MLRCLLSVACASGSSLHERNKRLPETSAAGDPASSSLILHVLWSCASCSKRERVEVFVSDLALLLVTSGLYKLGTTFAWTWLLCTYGVPYLVVNHYLVRRHSSTHAVTATFSGARFCRQPGAVSVSTANMHSCKGNDTSAGSIAVSRAP